MTNDTTTTPDPTPDPTPLPESDPSTTPDAGEGGYAVYDETLLRFVGGVHPKKADAEKARKSLPSSHKSHKTKVRKV